MKTVDVLIIGQGTAGTILDFYLQKENKTAFFYDVFIPNSSSQVAAGIINPVTGRRFVKSWKIEDFLPIANKTYDDLGTYFNEKFNFSLPIARHLPSVKQENDWYARFEQEGYRGFLENNLSSSKIDNCFKNESNWGFVMQGGRVALQNLLGKYRDLLKKENRINEGLFDYSKLEINNGFFYYENIRSEKIVFSEGIQAQNNLFFPDLEFVPAKGHVLMVEIKGMPQDYIVKNNVFFVPQGGNLFWVGSDYVWSPKDGMPIQNNLDKIEERMANILDIPYTIKGVRSAIRPTVKDRRPFVFSHPENKNMWMFNGFGTKGTSMIPYFAMDLVRKLFI